MVLRATPQMREEKDRVRHALLRAALQLGAQHGFASLGLREVSRAASIAPTSFYRHFTDMSELGLALVEELGRPLVNTLTVSTTAPSATASSLVDVMLAAVVEDEELVRFMIAERVGAFASLRSALAAEFDGLVRGLPTAGNGRPSGDFKIRTLPAADATVALILAGFARLLDLPPGERQGLRERLVSSLTLVFEASESRRGKDD